MAHSMAVSLPPMDCLAAALAAARLGSFSAAASELGVTHATISRRVAGAEAWAGVQLFDRHGRGVRTTPHGQQLLIRLAHALDTMNAVVDRERAPRRRPVVQISVTPAFARFWLFPRLAALEGDDLHVEVVAEMRAADLERGEVDLAIRYGPGGWKADHEEPLLGDQLVPMASARAFPRLADAEPAEILQLPLLHLSGANIWRAWAAGHGLAARRKPADRMLDGTAVAVDAALIGLGAGLWPTSLCAMEDLPPGRGFSSDPTSPSPPPTATTSSCARTDPEGRPRSWPSASARRRASVSMAGARGALMGAESMPRAWIADDAGHALRPGQRPADCGDWGGRDRPQSPLATCSRASASSSSIRRRIWWSDCSTPFSSKSLRILRNTSSSPTSSKSALTTSLA